MWDSRWFYGLSLLKVKESNDFTYTRITFQSCMHGGQRDKRIDLIFGGKVCFNSLALLCGGLHEHAPWSKTKCPGTHFATADERNYPDRLCARMAKRVAVAYGSSKESALLRLHDKVHSAEQPRRGMKALVPEYHSSRSFTKCSSREVRDIQGFQANRADFLEWRGVGLVKGCKVLSIMEEGGSGLSTVEVDRTTVHRQGSCSCASI